MSLLTEHAVTSWVHVCFTLQRELKIVCNRQQEQTTGSHARQHSLIPVLLFFPLSYLKCSHRKKLMFEGPVPIYSEFSKTLTYIPIFSYPVYFLQM